MCSRFTDLTASDVAGLLKLAGPCTVSELAVAAGDVLLVYGRTDHVCELDERPAGPAGERAHQQAVLRQDQEERSEHALDSGS